MVLKVSFNPPPLSANKLMTLGEIAVLIHHYAAVDTVDR